MNTVITDPMRISLGRWQVEWSLCDEGGHTVANGQVRVWGKTFAKHLAEREVEEHKAKQAYTVEVTTAVYSEGLRRWIAYGCAYRPDGTKVFIRENYRKHEHDSRQAYAYGDTAQKAEDRVRFRVKQCISVDLPRWMRVVKAYAESGRQIPVAKPTREHANK